MVYDDAAAAAFRAARHIPPGGLTHWQQAVGRQLAPQAGMRLLDLGAGTGAWAQAFTDWYGVDVVAVEPSAAMRARSCHPRTLAGQADALPFTAGSFGAAWLSTVIHHITDLPAAAAELRRVLAASAPVLIRSPFPGRHGQIGLFRFFPEAMRALDAYPTLDRVRQVFTAAGFRYRALEPVPQVTADSLAAVLGQISRDAHSPLRTITDASYEAGLARLRAAAATEHGPVIDTMDLLVFD